VDLEIIVLLKAIINFSKMWNLYEDEKKLEPLVFSNGKTQEDVIKEVLEAIEQGEKIIFIKGMCGTGKSAIALNLARKLGRASIVVPIKSLQEQYTKDYTGKKYVLHNGRRLKIQPILGRQNFKCGYLEETDSMKELKISKQEKDVKLTEIFLENSFNKNSEKNKTCDNIFLPCKIEIKEKNLSIIRDYIKENPDILLTSFIESKSVNRISGFSLI
jgi:DNA helicase TIP49 (TBP-interacting protein)